MNIVNSQFIIVVMKTDQNKDGKYLVHHSMNIHLLAIVVAFHYQLGYLAFLPSRELKEEARAMDGVRYANLGLHDQRLVLQWVSDGPGLSGH